jgi:hypothetical protein
MTDDAELTRGELAESSSETADPTRHSPVPGFLATAPQGAAPMGRRLEVPLVVPGVVTPRLALANRRVYRFPQARHQEQEQFLESGRM